MRVLHLYAGNLWGGVERMLVTLARCRALAPQMDPHFALCFDARLARGLRDAGCEPVMLGTARVSRPWTVLAARTRLRRLHQRERFDVAVCHSHWPHAMFAPVVRSHGVPLVYWSHDVPTGRGWLERWARRNSPDLVLANSRFTAGAVPRLFNQVRCEVQYPPVEVCGVGDHESARRALRADFGTNDRAVVILLAARMVALKGHALLIEALGRLRDRGGWECWIAGAPQRAKERKHLARMKALAAQHRVDDRIRWLGQRDDIPALLGAADVYCQPNTSPEAFGIALIEAMSSGVPVVTTRLGGAIEIVDESCGILVEPDPVSLAEALRSLADSPDRRAGLGSAGARRAGTLWNPRGALGSLHGHLLHVARASYG